MWSSGFIGAELGTRFAPADTLLGWRYVVAAVLLVTWAAARGASGRTGARGPGSPSSGCCASASTSAGW